MSALKMYMVGFACIVAAPCVTAFLVWGEVFMLSPNDIGPPIAAGLCLAVLGAIGLSMGVSASVEEDIREREGGDH